MTFSYIILLLIGMLFVFLEDFLEEKDKIIIFIAICGIMILVPAFKDVHDTPDAINYEEMFYGTNAITGLLTEPSFLIISGILRSLGFTVSALFTVYAIIAINIRGRFIYRMSPLPILTLFIFISYLYILHDLIQIRAGAALAFGIGALYYYSNGRKRMALAMIGIATMFHYSAILLCLIFLFSNKPLTLKWKLLLYSIVPFGLILCILKLNLISFIPSFAGGERLEVYNDLAEKGQMDEASLINPILWIKILVYITALWFYDFLKDMNQYLSLFIKIMGLSVLIELTLLFTNAVLAYRLSELFAIVEPFIITSFVYLFRPMWIGRMVIVMVSTAASLYCIFRLEYILT